MMVDHSGAGEVGEAARGVCRGDVVADLAQVCRGESGVGAGLVREQPQLLTDVVGQGFRAGVDRPVAEVAGGLSDVRLEVGGRRVGGEDEVDE
ncbi:hypothetical protein AW168_25775 [Nocardia brasiliensis]|uniref:Uncharacterized protein n=1 Tax=Nocardia brasiliensis (strain ATCC 700358 / HUJEG-1) TaxID=1133849 RepID=K0ES63_NOCB7|nr:hypothetical protein O3I_009615 [Nocardia brasiliensis ATCC 700358]OCF87386.1 hypothetical protein AW168_25775 [Nocardia brasiliensis]